MTRVIIAERFKQLLLHYVYMPFIRRFYPLVSSSKVSYLCFCPLICFNERDEISLSGSRGREGMEKRRGRPLL